ncbi:MAG: sugar ABC transporter substrate-binding protein [Synergistaceae bacterium]|jgi:ribose transport system substrate-binding protein|nr:sugar ABC transporter substrate-binding protein [Synergistaceae bacterium]
MKKFLRVIATVLLIGLSLATTSAGFAFPPVRDTSKSDGKIHVVSKSLMAGTGFWTLIRQGILDISGSDAIGGAQVAVYSPAVDGDAQAQLGLMEIALQNNPMAIVVSPIDTDALAPYIEKAYDQGIPVVVFDDRASTEKYDAFYGTDNYAAAYWIGTHVGEMMRGKGTYATLSGTPQSLAEEARVNGFKDALKEKYPDIKHIEGGTFYSNYDQTRAYGYAQDLLTSHPDINCIFGAFSLLLNSTAVVMQEAGKEKQSILLPTFDTDDDGTALTEQSWFTGFVQQDPYHEVQDAIKRAHDIAVGKVARLDKPEIVPVRYMWITPENIKTEEAQKFLYPARISEKYDIISN